MTAPHDPRPSLPLCVRREDPGTEDAVRLIDELSAVLERLTGASGRASSDPASLRGPGACFVVARDAAGTAALAPPSA